MKNLTAIAAILCCASIILEDVEVFDMLNSLECPAVSLPMLGTLEAEVDAQSNEQQGKPIYAIVGGGRLLWNGFLLETHRKPRDNTDRI